VVYKYQQLHRCCEDVAEVLSEVEPHFPRDTLAKQFLAQTICPSTSERAGEELLLVLAELTPKPS
jgi:hypothetical protein